MQSLCLLWLLLQFHLQILRTAAHCFSLNFHANGSTPVFHTTEDPVSSSRGGHAVIGDPEFGHWEGEKPQNIAVVLSEDGKRWDVAVLGSVPADLWSVSTWAKREAITKKKPLPQKWRIKCTGLKSNTKVFNWCPKSWVDEQNLCKTFSAQMVLWRAAWIQTTNPYTQVLC